MLIVRQHTRLLLVIANFAYLSKALIPSIVSELETAFGINIEQDRQVGSSNASHLHELTLGILQMLMVVVQELDKTLFESYVDPRTKILTRYMREGILESNIDWYDCPQPTGQPHALSSFRAASD